MDEVLPRLKEALADRYTVEREIGRGGMSLVYSAQDLRNQRNVALKVLRPELAESVGAERFLREIKIAANLEHPHILPLFDSGEADGLLYYTMPFVEGESLRDRLKREGALPLDDALQIAKEVGEALAHAHEHGVVHRDIKPENILLASGIARVADFGIARARTEAGEFNSVTDANIAIGTPEYMSPEQAGGSDTLDGRTDIYSLGCVLYEMLAGEPPFTGRTLQAIIAKHLGEKVPTLTVVRPGIPLRVVKLIEKSLAKVPADRHASARDFAKECAEILSTPTGDLTAAVSPDKLPTSVRPLGYLAALTLVVMGAMLIPSLLDGPAGSAVTTELDPRRIAVLYFEDRSQQRDEGHLAESFSEDLIDALDDVGSLSVIPRSGVRPYRAGSAQLDEIASALAVGSVVDGTIEGSRDSLRLTVRLIDVARQVQLESRTLVAARGDPFQLREAMADSVSRFLRERLGEEIRVQAQRAGTNNPEAWELLQRAEQERKTCEDLRTARDVDGAHAALDRGDSLLSIVHELDERWIEPLVLRGWLALDKVSLWEDGMPAADTARAFGEVRRAIELAEHAVGVEPNNAEALELRGTARYVLFDSPLASGAPRPPALRAEAEVDLRAAVGTHQWPARALATLCKLVRRRGDFQQARLLAEQAVAEDQFLAETRDVMFELAQALLDDRQVTEAVEVCEDGRRRFSEEIRFSACVLTALAASDELEPDVSRAWQVAGEMVERSSERARPMYLTSGHMQVAAVLARAGLGDSAEAVVRRALLYVPADHPAAGSLAYYEAAAWLKIGDKVRSLEALERFLEASPQRRPYITDDWFFSELWADPQFHALVSVDSGSN